MEDTKIDEQPHFEKEDKKAPETIEQYIELKENKKRKKRLKS